MAARLDVNTTLLRSPFAFSGLGQEVVVEFAGYKEGTHHGRPARLILLKVSSHGANSNSIVDGYEFEIRAGPTEPPSQPQHRVEYIPIPSAIVLGGPCAIPLHIAAPRVDSGNDTKKPPLLVAWAPSHLETNVFESEHERKRGTSSGILAATWRPDASAPRTVYSGVQELREHPEKSVRQVARERNIAKSTLHDRWTHTHLPLPEAVARHLSPVQEDVLVDKINEYAARGTLLTPRHVRDLAEAVCGEEIGENWVGRFVDRHSDRISSRYHTYRELARLQADCQEVRRAWFTLVSELYDSRLYDPAGIYNVDESFFSLSYGRTTRRIAPRNHPRNAQAVSGSTEHITVVACIGLDTAPVPPFVIYPGQHLYDVWFTDDVPDVPQKAAATHSGWINSYLMQKWLEDVFDPSTRDRVAAGRRRLLFMDGHESHVKVEFLEACWDRDIVVVILPANASSFLQPLDVGFFNPLKTRFFGRLDDHRKALGNDEAPAKGVFWSFHQKAWKETATARQIRSAWRKAGLWPLNAAAMGLHDVSTPPRDLQPAGEAITTPRTPRTLKHHQRSCRRGDLDVWTYLMKVEKALEANTSELAILKAQVARDHAARDLEKAARGKRKRASYPHGQLFDPKHRDEHAAELAERKAREAEARGRRAARAGQGHIQEPQEPRQACTPGPSTSV